MVSNDRSLRPLHSAVSEAMAVGACLRINATLWAISSRVYGRLLSQSALNGEISEMGASGFSLHRLKRMWMPWISVSIDRWLEGGAVTAVV